MLQTFTLDKGKDCGWNVGKLAPKKNVHGFIFKSISQRKLQNHIAPLVYSAK